MKTTKNSLPRTGSARRLVAAVVVCAGCVCCFVMAEPVLAQPPVAGNPPAGGGAMASSAIPGNGSSGMTRNLLAVLQEGGTLLIPLGVCSFLLLLFAFERSISLRRGRVIPRPFVKRFLAQLEDGVLDSREALQLCRENGSPVAEVFAAGVMKWDRSSVEVEQAIIDSGERVAQGLRRDLRLFNGISTISPLLGLLGTVVGMIKAFNAIATADAMGKPELLATGISEALITTAAGLTVAIPAIVICLYFASKADTLVMEIDRHGQQLVNAIAIDGWKEKKTKTKTRRAA